MNTRPGKVLDFGEEFNCAPAPESTIGAFQWSNLSPCLQLSSWFSNTNLKVEPSSHRMGFAPPRGRRSRSRYCRDQSARRSSKSTGCTALVSTQAPCEETVGRRAGAAQHEGDAAAALGHRRGVAEVMVLCVPVRGDEVDEPFRGASGSAQDRPA